MQLVNIATTTVPVYDCTGIHVTVCSCVLSMVPGNATVTLPAQYACKPTYSLLKHYFISMLYDKMNYLQGVQMK